MPKIGIGETPLIRAAKEELEKDPYLKPDFLSEEQLLELAKHYSEEVVGRGTECIVLHRNKDNPDDRELLDAIRYQDYSTLQAKNIFYLQRIFSTLFPKNFPRFHAAFSGKTSGTIRQKVPINSSSQEGKEFAKELIKKSAELGIPGQGFTLDGSPRNYLLDDNNNCYYVDTIKNFDRPDLWDTEKIKTLMSENGYTQKQIRIVETSVDRLKKLYEPED